VTQTESRVGNWGRWGDEDERGALNLLTPEVVLAATKIPKSGKVYALGLPIQRIGVPWFDYRGAPMRLSLEHQSDRGQFELSGAPDHVGANEDVLVFASHNETHMDALCHVFWERQMYNGIPVETVSASAGATKLGIDKVKGFAARAVLLDMPRHLGVGDWFEGEHIITSAELDACAQAQGVEVRPGDVLLVRTGWVDKFLANNPTQSGPANDPIQAGLGFDACEFVADHDVCAVGCDNSAVESIPFDRNEFLGIHIELLVKRGIYFLEHLMLKEMADDRCHEALIVVSPLNVTGGTGSPINPIAIG
jgi:kynurenine formamidase